MEPTAYGQALLKCGVAVFDEMRQGIKQIEFLDDPTSGELRIGCPDIITAGLLPAIIERFSRDYPRVRFHVVHANTAVMQVQELRNRTVELLFGRTPLPVADEDLAVETLFDEPFVAVAGAHSKWARRRSLELRDLLQEPWILPPLRQRPRCSHLGDFSCGQTATSDSQPGDPISSALHQSDRRGQLRQDLAALGRALYPQGWLEDFARPPGRSTVSGWDHHREKSVAEPACIVRSLAGRGRLSANSNEPSSSSAIGTAPEEQGVGSDRECVLRARPESPHALRRMRFLPSAHYGLPRW